MLWQISHTLKTGCHTHHTAPGFGHALLMPAASIGFAALRVSASVTNGDFWWSLHSAPSVQGVELEHGHDRDRHLYNLRQFAQVRRRRSMVRGELFGFSDFFVPVLARGEIAALLVVGPVALERPTNAAVLQRWRRMTGRQANLADPEFAAYLSASLGTLVLEGSHLHKFERLLAHVAGILSGEGDAGALANRAERLYVELRVLRAAEVMWEAVRSMIDDRFSKTWSSGARVADLYNLGLSRAPGQVIVGLSSSRDRDDPIDEAIRRESFQRASVELARKLGNVVVGKVGDHGVVFIAGSGTAQKRRLKDLTERALTLAKRLGLSLHLGVSAASEKTPLSRSYQVALGAAQSALDRRLPLLVAEGSARPHLSLGRLRRELGAIATLRSDQGTARFERYLEAVAVHCNYRLEAARGHLEAGFERIAEPLLTSGALEERSFWATSEALERAAARAPTLSDLFAAYRGAAADLWQAVERPVPARRDRSLRSALDYIHQHYTESLRLEKVARVAGFAPSHFSRLFAEKVGTPFVDYIAGLRLERSKQLLTSTALDANRLAELSGFRSAQYFSRAFRKHVGMTPLQYRKGGHPHSGEAWKVNDLIMRGQ